MYDNVGECKRQCKRLACSPRTGVEPGSVVSRGGWAAWGDREHVGCHSPGLRGNSAPSVPETTCLRQGSIPTSYERVVPQDAADMFPETGHAQITAAVTCLQAIPSG
jgi:hypothetical protein